MLYFFFFFTTYDKKKDSSVHLFLQSVGWMYMTWCNAELIYLRRAICIQKATLTLPEFFFHKQQQEMNNKK